MNLTFIGLATKKRKGNWLESIVTISATSKISNELKKKKEKKKEEEERKKEKKDVQAKYMS